MKISADKFIDWAESRFDSVLVHGNEVKLNSIFTDDTHHKLWCNTNGGKKGQPPCFQCWKTGNKGSLISLVCLVDNCDYETALEALGGENIVLLNLERKLKEFFDNKNKKPEEEQEEEVSNTLALPPFSSLITELPVYNFHRVQAEVYLFDRRLPIEGLYVTTGGGQYRQRVVIPYYDRNGILIYFNARYIGKLPNVNKYLGPDKKTGVGKEDVIYMPKWPSFGSKVYLTEGEFDALSIWQSGKGELYAGAFGGKNLSEKQVEMIRHYLPVLCLDTDKAGKSGLTKMAMILRSKGLTPTFVRPPAIYKDWNAMLQKIGSEALVFYIRSKEKPLDDAALMRLLA
ncbi:MAG: toprim domain-containing protein [Proteobacteria bacterium]|jgi:hypothetical protein|nr:toprim domain-containing protein [Pseudomonadota bacterium]